MSGPESQVGPCQHSPSTPGAAAHLEIDAEEIRDGDLVGSALRPILGLNLSYHPCGRESPVLMSRGLHSLSIRAFETYPVTEHAISFVDHG